MLNAMFMVGLQILYAVGATGLAIYGLQALVLTMLKLHSERLKTHGHLRAHGEAGEDTPDNCVDWPAVTVQLPVFNEVHVVGRLIDACAKLDYPSNRLQIQVLDDSTDGTTVIAERRAAFWRKRGVEVKVLHRSDRQGFKAGALKKGLAEATGEYVAVFDADFVPHPDFLKRTIPSFLDSAAKHFGFVQTRWTHLNAEYSALTRAQALALDGHFVVEQAARHAVGLSFGFNGSAGVWRKACIEDPAVGGWQDDTLCEDLDLSYRAQLAGWRGDYLDDVEAPAELPPQLLAFKRQQFRWAKGSVATLRKLATSVWQGGWPTLKRTAAYVHLGGYLIHPLLLVLLLVSPLLMLSGSQPYLPLAYLSLVSIGPPALYALAQRRLHKRDWLRRWAHLPLLMLLGMGLSLSNSVAAWQAIFGRGGAFLRTPKFRVEGGSDSWHWSGYALELEPIVAAELFLSLYAGIGCYIAVIHGQWLNLPFLALYACGYAFVALFGCYESWMARSSRIPVEGRPAKPFRPKDLVKY